MHAVRRLSLSYAALLAIAAAWVAAGLGSAPPDCLDGRIAATAQAGPSSPVDTGGTAFLPQDASLSPDGVPATPAAGLRSAESLPLALTRFNRLPRQARLTEWAGGWGAADGPGQQGVVLLVDRWLTVGGRLPVGTSLVAQNIRLQV